MNKGIKEVIQKETWFAKNHELLNLCRTHIWYRRWYANQKASCNQKLHLCDNGCLSCCLGWHGLLSLNILWSVAAFHLQSSMRIFQDYTKRLTPGRWWSWIRNLVFDSRSQQGTTAISKSVLLVQLEFTAPWPSRRGHLIHHHCHLRCWRQHQCCWAWTI